MKKKTFKLALFILVFPFMGCTNNDSHNSIEEVSSEFPVITLSESDTMYHTDYIAELKASQYVEVRARVKGFIESIMVDEGQYVNKGQPLFRISSEEYKTDLSMAKASLKNTIAEKKVAMLDFDRVKMLVDSNIFSPSELKIIEAKIESLNAKIEEEESKISQASLTLSYTEIKAPFNGYINRIILKQGSLVDEGSLITTIADNNELFAYFNVSEKDYLSFMRNRIDNDRKKEVELILADGTIHPYNGFIETIEGEFDQITGNIAFRAKFINPKLIIRHGASGKVRITRKVNQSILLPQISCFDVQDRSFVFVVDSNNRAIRRRVTLGMRLSHFYIVKEGLQIGETIVYEGVQNIRDSMVIKPNLIQLETRISNH